MCSIWISTVRQFLGSANSIFIFYYFLFLSLQTSFCFVKIYLLSTSYIFQYILSKNICTAQMSPYCAPDELLFFFYVFSQRLISVSESWTLKKKKKSRKMTKSIWHSSRYSLSSPLTSNFNFPPLESAILPEGLCEAKAHTSASTGTAEPQKQRIQDAIWFVSLTQTALLITPLSDIFYNLFLKIPNNRHFTASSILGLINPSVSSNSNLPSLFVKQKLCFQTDFVRRSVCV